MAKGTYQAVESCLNGTPVVVCVLNHHVTILGGYSNSNWNVANPASNVTIIDGQNVRRGIQLWGINSASASLRIEGFTIQNGFFQGASSGSDDATFGFGGGMLADRGQLIARNLIFKNNLVVGGSTATYGGSASGGGLALRLNPEGTLLENIVFDNNESRGGTGGDRGGLALGGGLFTYGAHVNGSNITFEGNTAVAGNTNGSGLSVGLYADGQGGGAAFQVGSIIFLSGITAQNNQAIGGNAPNGNAGGAFGGAIFAEIASTVHLSDFDLRNNLAQGGNGQNPNTNGSLGEGGGFASSNSEILLERGLIVNNRAQGGNGAIYEGASGGGGLYSERFTGSTTVTLENIIVADNVTETGTGTAVGGGGGGYFVNGAAVNLIHTTFVNNQLNSSPMQGSGLVLLNGGTATISHSILANHTDGITVHAQPGSSITLNNNLFSGNSTNTGGGGTFTGTASIFSGSPDFLSPGAPNYDYRLRSSSAAINKAVSSSTASDFEGDDRTQFGQRDVGADEYAPIVLTFIPGNGQIQLNWEPKSLLLTGVTQYQIRVTPSGGAANPNEGTSINAGLQTSFTLTGLTNYKNYTVFIEAKNSGDSVIGQSNSVTGFPTDIAVYLPFVTR
ncbi:MAG: fibronectin type III domain-containing protein [Anaerolineaceae bacterium]|nr:fibronectin type III domain-containing protein [Anaerolineaceae bacterium]